MTEELSKLRKGWKVWKNPKAPEEPVVYLGELYPPESQFCLTGCHLKELGFGPGEYTVLAPEGFKCSGLFARWQRVSIPEC
jgi:hypothetical protein